MKSKETTWAAEIGSGNPEANGFGPRNPGDQANQPRPTSSSPSPAGQMSEQSDAAATWAAVRGTSNPEA